MNVSVTETSQIEDSSTFGERAEFESDTIFALFINFAFYHEKANVSLTVLF